MVLQLRLVRCDALRGYRTDQTDVLFSNIKHLFFQPSEKELIVLIHINLRSPIMLGKKKTYVSFRTA